jgi:hypothetical protein
MVQICEPERKVEHEVLPRVRGIKIFGEFGNASAQTQILSAPKAPWKKHRFSEVSTGLDPGRFG